MRRWLSLTTVLALLLCKTGANLWGKWHEPLKPCPENSVCVAFVHDQCDKEKGRIWENKDSHKCPFGDHGYLFARLDIQPLGLSKWGVIVTLSTNRDGKLYKPEDFKFNFGKSNLIFDGSSENATHGKAYFSWEQKNRDGKHASDESVLNKTDSFWSQSKSWFHIANHGAYEFEAFSFEIETDRQKLLDVVGPVVDLDYNGGHYVLNDQAFPEKLSKLTKCDASEIKEVCYGTCEKIFSDPKLSSNSNSTSIQYIRELKCSSHLWFHSPSDGAMFRQWKKVEKLDCYMGWFRANWTSWDADATKGSQNIIRTDEVQCSIEKPRKLTTLASVVFGVSGGIIGLLVVAGVVAFVVCFLKRRNNHRRHGKTEKKFTIRDSDSRAQTPGGKSTERERF